MLPLSSAWQAAAEKLIEEFGNLEDTAHFAGKVFRKQFFPIVAQVYFDEMMAGTDVSKLQVSKLQVVERLKLDAGTYKRWVNKSHPPAADKFFAVVLLLLNRDLKSFAFSSPDRLLFKAIDLQLHRFARDFCDPPQCVMTRLAFRSLIHAMRDASSERLVPGSNYSKDIREKALVEAVSKVNEGLEEDSLLTGAMAPEVKSNQLATWLSNWGMPYTLLAIGTKNVSWGRDDAKI